MHRTTDDQIITWCNTAVILLRANLSLDLWKPTNYAMKNRYYGLYM